jgi:hypothetical protein
MKKLLTLLLLSPFALSEMVNLSCKYNELSDIESLSIDANLKFVKTKSGVFKYTERGNTITWHQVYVATLGDSYAMADRYDLDRITGEFQWRLKTRQFNDGIKAEDLTKLHMMELYEFQEAKTGSCEKVEVLF